MALTGSPICRIDGFTGEPFRICLELDRARLYVLRADVDFLYGWAPQVNLAGDYIPDQLPGLTAGRLDAYTQTTLPAASSPAL